MNPNLAGTYMIIFMVVALVLGFILIEQDFQNLCH